MKIIRSLFGGGSSMEKRKFPSGGTRHENQLVVTKLVWPDRGAGSGIGGKKPAGRNFSATQLGDGCTRYWGERAGS